MVVLWGRLRRGIVKLLVNFMERDLALGGRLTGLYRSMERERTEFDTWWTRLRDFVMPFSPEGFRVPVTLSDGVVLKGLTDSTAVIACERLAAAHQSHITPSYKRWLTFEESPAVMVSDNAEKAEVATWFATSTEVTMQAFTESNFYSATHEMYQDRVGAGTGCLFADKDNWGRLLFTRVPFGSFVASEDASGNVNCVGRVFEFTADQAVEFWGKDRVSEQILAVFGDEGRRYTEKFKFLHFVRKRERWFPGRLKCGRPYESIYVEMGSHNVLEHPDDDSNGFEEFPFAVSRFAKWESVYGYAPGRRVWPDILGAQRHRRILNVNAELSAFPRILKSAKQSGVIDMRPAGETIVSEADIARNLPREWATQGRSIEGAAEWERCKESIKMAFYLDILQLFENSPGNKTATEVNAMLDERLIAFSPTFSQFVSDFRPMMQRVFFLLYRKGAFPEPPECLLRKDASGEVMKYADGLPMIVEPGMVYNSKFAQMLRELQNSGMLKTMEFLGNVGQMGERGLETLDLVDFDYVLKKVGRANGVPEGFFVKDKLVKEVRKRREEQRAMAQQMAMMEAEAKAQQGAGVPGGEGVPNGVPSGVVG